MSSQVRVKVEFNKFDDSELRNQWMMIAKDDVKTVTQLKSMIAKRFKLKHDFVLLMDAFELNQFDFIDIIRDEDTIVYVF